VLASEPVWVAVWELASAEAWAVVWESVWAGEGPASESVAGVWVPVLVLEVGVLEPASVGAQPASR